MGLRAALLTADLNRLEEAARWRRFLFFCAPLLDSAWGGKWAGEGKIKALSRDARQVLVCTSFFREIGPAIASRIVSRVEAATWQSKKDTLWR